VTIAFVYKRMGKRVAVFYILSIIAVSVLTGLIFDELWVKIGTGIDLITAGGTHLPYSIKFIAAVLMAIIFLNSRYPLEKFLKRKRSINMEVNKNIHKIKVPDMVCQHCMMRITDALKKMPEIKKVSIDLKTKNVSVNSTLDRQIILDSIKQVGYQPQ
jgi:copper chaperone